jgi:hypothetical protein
VLQVSASLGKYFYKNLDCWVTNSLAYGSISLLFWSTVCFVSLSFEVFKGRTDIFHNFSVCREITHLSPSFADPIFMKFEILRQIYKGNIDFRQSKSNGSRVMTWHIFKDCFFHLCWRSPDVLKNCVIHKTLVLFSSTFFSDKCWTIFEIHTEWHEVLLVFLLSCYLILKENYYGPTNDNEASIVQFSLNPFIRSHSLRPDKLRDGQAFRTLLAQSCYISLWRRPSIQ